MRSTKTRMALALLSALPWSLTACCQAPQPKGPLVISTSESSVKLLPSSDYQVSRDWMRHVVVTVATLQRDNERLRKRVAECK